MSKTIIGLFCVFFLFSISTAYTLNSHRSPTYISPSQRIDDTLDILSTSQRFDEMLDLLEEGRNLLSQEAEALEIKLTENPNDLSSRIKLLSYYFEKGEDLVSNASQKHILWIIEHHPESEIAGEPQCEITKGLNPVNYSEAKQMWLKQVEIQKNNLNVLANAFRFFFTNDKELAENLLLQAEMIDPDNPRWPEELGMFYSVHSITASENERSRMLTQALEKFERALFLTDDSQKADIIGRIAKAEFEVGNTSRAKVLALDLLHKYGKTEDDSYNDAIFVGHLILGRVALQEGNISEAKARLIASAKTSGSPVLSSFGPDMTLAKELLEKGEKTAVIKYLHLCAKFWEPVDGRLKEWEDAIQNGEIPDLTY
jgi:tetratricopeptide (TPR) repeat protein